MKHLPILALSGAMAVATPIVADAEIPDTSADTMAQHPADHFDGPCVTAMWEKDIANERTATSVWSTDRTTLHGLTCGNEVSVESVGISLAFKTDDEGYGSLRTEVNGDVVGFSTDFNPDFSGGISCTREWNHEHAITECVIPITTELPANTTTFAGDGALECFPELDEDDVDSVSLAAFDEDEGEDMHMSEEDVPALLPRQAYIEKTTNKVGNGNPHKYRRIKQLTARADCNGRKCSIAKGKTFSYTHTATFGIAGVGRADWISAGYSVGFTNADTTTVTCNGRPNDVICVKHRQNYQGYKVRTRWYDHGTGKIIKKVKDVTYQQRSPVKSALAKKFLCAANTCGWGKGNLHWINEGPGKWPAA